FVRNVRALCTVIRPFHSSRALNVLNVLNVHSSHVTSSYVYHENVNERENGASQFRSRIISQPPNPGDGVVCEHGLRSFTVPTFLRFRHCTIAGPHRLGV
ncbi:hypothetical protein BC938DRAFT_474957, partial [Jimgerdemannia flammicorona]